jgi:hypothetical protein
MVDIELLVQIEDALVGRITPPLSDIGVRVFAGDRKDGAPQSVTHEVLVFYPGSNWSSPTDFLGAGDQQRVMVWQISMRLKQLFGETYRLCLRVEQAVINAVKGFQPHHCVDGKFYPVSSRLRPRDDQGYFWYEIMIGIKDKRSNG